MLTGVIEYAAFSAWYKEVEISPSTTADRFLLCSSTYSNMSRRFAASIPRVYLPSSGSWNPRSKLLWFVRAEPALGISLSKRFRPQCCTVPVTWSSCMSKTLHQSSIGEEATRGVMVRYNAIVVTRTACPIVLRYMDLETTYQRLDSCGLHLRSCTMWLRSEALAESKRVRVKNLESRRRQNQPTRVFDASSTLHLVHNLAMILLHLGVLTS